MKLIGKVGKVRQCMEIELVGIFSFPITSISFHCVTLLSHVSSNEHILL
jgi:hypothetical protein